MKIGIDIYLYEFSVTPEGGKAAADWCLDSQKEWSVILAADIGGSKIAVGLVDPTSGDVLEQTQNPVEKRGQGFLSELSGRLGEMMLQAACRDIQCTGVGIGIAEIVSPDGSIASRQTFELGELKIQEGLHTRLPVTVDSDVRCAALAEARFGAGRSFGTFFYVSIGTGVSSALVIEGKVLVGAHGAALVLGSGSIPKQPRPDATDTFCLEEFASGEGVARRYRAEAGGAVSGAKDVMVRAENGDEEASRIVEEAGFAMGVAIAQAINVLDPEAVILGGGLGSADGRYREAVLAAARRHIWYGPARETPITTAHLGPRSGLVGAALSAARRGPTA